MSVKSPRTPADILCPIHNSLEVKRIVDFDLTLDCAHLPTIKGLDEAGETVWEKWGTTKGQLWKGHKSCLDIQRGILYVRWCSGPQLRYSATAL